MPSLFDALSYEFMRNALLAGVLIGGVAMALSGLAGSRRHVATRSSDDAGPEV